MSSFILCLIFLLSYVSITSQKLFYFVFILKLDIIGIILFSYLLIR